MKKIFIDPTHESNFFVVWINSETLKLIIYEKGTGSGWVDESHQHVYYHRQVFYLQ